MPYLDKSKQIELLKIKYPNTTTWQLNAAYIYTKDVERDNKSKIETWEDYFPKCLAEILEESK